MARFGRNAPRWFDRVFACAIIGVTVPVQLLQFTPAEWSLQTSLPLQLCDFAWIFAAHALWTRSRLSASVIYLWGLTLTTQAILTPALGSPYPEPRFFMFWAMHLLIVWSAVYVITGMALAPTWRTYGQTVLITLGWAAGATLFNLVAGTNYGYLLRKPANRSALDLFGPWPYYVAVEIAVVAITWALLTWPWARRSRALVREIV